MRIGSNTSFGSNILGVVMKCEHCDAAIDHLHNMLKDIGLCEECYKRNADDNWEEFLMTRDACR